MWRAIKGILTTLLVAAICGSATLLIWSGIKHQSVGDLIDSWRRPQTTDQTPATDPSDDVTAGIKRGPAAPTTISTSLSLLWDGADSTGYIVGFRVVSTSTYTDGMSLYTYRSFTGEIVRAVDNGIHDSWQTDYDVWRDGNVASLSPAQTISGQAADEILLRDYTLPSSGYLMVRGTVHYDSSLGGAGLDRSFRVLIGRTWAQSDPYDPSATVPLPDAPSKDGYDFAGWYYDAEYTRPYDGAPITADTALYAKYTPKTYTVRYDTAGGSAVSSTTVTHNGAAQYDQIPTREGYTFRGWLLGSVPYTGQPVTGNITLVADWAVQQCVITCYVDGELYTTLTVDWGTRLVDAMRAAALTSMTVTAVKTDGEAVQYPPSSYFLIQDAEVQLTATPAQRVEHFAAMNIIPIAVILCGIIALCALVIFRK